MVINKKWFYLNKEHFTQAKDVTPKGNYRHVPQTTSLKL